MKSYKQRLTHFLHNESMPVAERVYQKRLTIPWVQRFLSMGGIRENRTRNLCRFPCHAGPVEFSTSKPLPQINKRDTRLILCAFEAQCWCWLGLQFFWLNGLNADFNSLQSNTVQLITMCHTSHCFASNQNNEMTWWCLGLYFWHTCISLKYQQWENSFRYPDPLYA